jgi:exodeoxyribonuclease VII large subunit
MRIAMRGALQTERERLSALRGRLLALSPLTVLARGYAIVTNDSGQPLTRASAVAVGDTLRVRLAEGRLGARVLTRDEDAT